MTIENAKKLASVVAATFVGAFLGYLIPSLSAVVPTTEAQWKSVLLVGAGMGLTAVVHLYQAPPAGSAAAIAMAAKLGVPPGGTRGFVVARPLAALALLAVLGVGVAPSVAARTLPHVPDTALAACTPAQAANNIQTALTGTQALCVAAQLDAPTFGAPALTVSEIKTACSLATGLEGLIQQAIADYAAQKTSATARATSRARASGALR